MDPDAIDPRASQFSELWHANQKRRSYDIIRVYNPTNEDFHVQYDVNLYQKIAAKTTTDVPRFIADRYAYHMFVKIVNDEAKRMHDEDLKKRDVEGKPRYSDKYVENLETYNTQSYPKTNDNELKDKIYPTLILGLVSKVGMDRPPGIDQKGSSLFEGDDLIRVENLMNKRIDEVEQKPLVTTDFSGLSKKLNVDDVTND